jgi:hypothetical protein
MNYGLPQTLGMLESMKEQPDSQCPIERQRPAQSQMRQSFWPMQSFVNEDLAGRSACIGKSAACRTVLHTSNELIQRLSLNSARAEVERSSMWRQGDR